MILLYALSQSLPPSMLIISTNTSSLFDPVTGECININGCRTATGILWSCLSVILACTWVAIHPNIPKVGTHSAVVVCKDIELMVIAILAPEVIILWAMRQWYSAKAITKQFKKYGWGMSHAFFVIMGGFTLYERDTFIGYLWNDNQDIDHYTLWVHRQVHRQAHNHGRKHLTYAEYMGKVEKYNKWIRMHIQRVQNLSPQQNALMTNSVESIKGTPKPLCPLEYLVAKGYITITEGEIKDRSHADFIAKSIALIQTTWFILQIAAHAAEGLAITELEIVTAGFALLNFGTYILWWNKPLQVQYPVQVTWQQQELDVPFHLKEHKGGWMWVILEGVAAIWGYIFGGVRPDNLLHLLFQLLLLPLHIAWKIVATCLFLFSEDSVYSNEFPTRLEKDPLQLYITVYFIAAAFGAIHCIPWAFHFHFPAHTEQLFWQMCAVAVAAAPIAMGLFHWWWKELHNSTPQLLRNSIVYIFYLLSISYTLSRITLIVLSLMALRDLSPSGHQTVQWTTFIPHIG
ncbi:hypothetical protein Moror_11822 [Moniliophthora roreri MCA 2997]|uniref:Uncharacterized protein n=2 Tax=Moniliophthora roreri TaxID=221103 RepID=V2XU49_MONRO|nr:hypothetical protein Moror_11822 [Moniliophthora roreri MCA 2997]